VYLPHGPRAEQTPQEADPLFPEYARRSQAAPTLTEDCATKHRYDRWVRLLPTGQLPTDRDVLFWAATHRESGTEAPLLAGGAVWSHVPKDSSAPSGILIKFGNKKGSVHIWLRKQGKVHISASKEQREKILRKIEAWTAPWDSGDPPSPSGRPRCAGRPAP